MRVFLLAAALLAIGSAGSAQTTTDCTRDALGSVHCTTQPNSGVDWSLVQPHPDPRFSQSPAPVYGPGLAAQIAQDRVNHENKKVGKLLAQGDCAGAQQYALKAGRFDLVDQAKAYCPK